jgi:hypothetical protein
MRSEPHEASALLCSRAAAAANAPPPAPAAAADTQLTELQYAQAHSACVALAQLW